MKRLAVLSAIVVGLALALGGLAPAQAATRPTITSVIPAGTVSPEEVLVVQGDGCEAGSSVSFKVWSTGGWGAKTWNSKTTAAAPTGFFVTDLPLAGDFPAGGQIAITASCTSVYDGTRSADPSYRFIQLPPEADPGLALEVPTSVSYGQLFDVVARTAGAAGRMTVWIDSAIIVNDELTSGLTWRTIRTPLAVGTHVVKASFRLNVDPSRTFTTTATLRVTPRASSLRLTASKKAVKKRKKVTFTATVSTTGSKTGTVRFKNGSKTLKTVTLRAADQGVARIKVKLPVGLRTITATFSGNASVAPATSSPVKVQVGKKKKAKKPKKGKKGKKGKKVKR